MNNCQKRMFELQQIITQVSPEEAFEMQNQGAKIIDVRTIDEYQHSHIKDCIYLGRDHLEFKIEEIVLDKNSPIVIACGSGYRSLFASESIIKLGFKNVYNLDTGFKGWVGNNLPIETH
jgi:rhodanese-related sulfurtransferase